MVFDFEQCYFSLFICKLSKNNVYMIDNLFINKSLQTTILTDGVRKHRQTAEQYIQANDGKTKKK